MSLAGLVAAIWVMATFHRHRALPSWALLVGSEAGVLTKIGLLTKTDLLSSRFTMRLTEPILEISARGDVLALTAVR